MRCGCCLRDAGTTLGTKSRVRGNGVTARSAGSQLRVTALVTELRTAGYRRMAAETPHGPPLSVSILSQTSMELRRSYTGNQPCR